MRESKVTPEMAERVAAEIRYLAYHGDTDMGSALEALLSEWEEQGKENAKIEARAKSEFEEAKRMKAGWETVLAELNVSERSLAEARAEVAKLTKVQEDFRFHEFWNAPPEEGTKRDYLARMSKLASERDTARETLRNVVEAGDKMAWKVDHPSECKVNSPLPHPYCSCGLTLLREALASVKGEVKP